MSPEKPASRAFPLCLALFLLAASAGADGVVVFDRQVSEDRHPRPPRELPLPVLETRQHRVSVSVADQVAVTRVEQVFFNPTRRRLEGTYLFPLPAAAQINRFTMDIDGRPVEAELLPADQARRIYTDIVRRMQDPALLEFAHRGLVRMRIFPIEPGSEKRVTLSYTELLPRDGNLIHYVYPLSSGRFPAPTPARVSVSVDIASTRPLKAIYSPSHDVEVRRQGEKRARVGYEAGPGRPVGGGASRTDFQLLFSQPPAHGDDIALDLLTYQDFFLLLASPGTRSPEAEVVHKDVVFVVDTSGSMAGQKLAQARRALEFCLAHLNPEDRFEIVRFSTEAEALFDGLVAPTRKNLETARRFVAEFLARGGTAIEEALLAALAPAGRRTGGGDAPRRPYTVIFLTDGRPTIGTNDEDQILASVRRGTEGSGVRVFPFGIGTDINTHLLDKMSEDSRAKSQYVLPDEDIEVKVSSFYTKINRPVLAHPQLSFGDGVKVRQVYPRHLPDVFEGDQLVVVGRYRGRGEAALELSGSVNQRRYHGSRRVRFDGGSDHDFIPRLWATRRVGYLLDEIRLRGENAELKDEVVRLARQYGLVTPYTAYLILEDEARRALPANNRISHDVDRDPGARRELEEIYRQLRWVKTGDGAVAGAQSNRQLKEASNLAVASEAARAGRSTGGALAAQVPPRHVQGKTFYRNGRQWVDAEVEAAAPDEQVRVRFNSEDYFDLLEKHPEALAWLSVSRNLLMRLSDTVYVITD